MLFRSLGGALGPAPAPTAPLRPWLLASAPPRSPPRLGGGGEAYPPDLAALRRPSLHDAGPGSVWSLPCPRRRSPRSSPSWPSSGPCSTWMMTMMNLTIIKLAHPLPGAPDVGCRNPRHRGITHPLVCSVDWGARRSVMRRSSIERISTRGIYPVSGHAKRITPYSCLRCISLFVRISRDC